MKKKVLFALASSVLLLAGAPLYSQRAGRRPGGVVFQSGARPEHPNNQIYVMDPDGSNQVRMTSDAASDTTPDISGNGEIVFASVDQTGNSDIYVLDRSGVAKNLTNNPANDGWPRWSPNGKQIAFESDRDGGIFEVYVMNADGSGPATRVSGHSRHLMNAECPDPTQITEPPVASRYPSWSPDGRRIVFRRGIDIYTSNADGSDVPLQLTHEATTSFAQMAAFSPDGQYIAFMSFRQKYLFRLPDERRGWQR